MLRLALAKRKEVSMDARMQYRLVAIITLFWQTKRTVLAQFIGIEERRTTDDDVFAAVIFLL